MYPDCVALSTHGLNQQCISCAAKLAPQVVHIHIHYIGAGRRLHLPHLLEQRGARNSTSAVEQQIFEQRKFLGGKRNRTAFAAHRALNAVYLQCAVPQ